MSRRVDGSPAPDRPRDGDCDRVAAPERQPQHARYVRVTSTAAKPPTRTAPHADASSSALTPRRVRGLALLVGGAVTALLLVPIGPVAFYYLPLVTGLTYLVAAALGGRTGALWAPGLIVTGFGVATWLTSPDGLVDGQYSFPLAIVGLGVGALLAAIAAEGGLMVGETSLALAILLTGVFVLAVFRIPELDKGWPFGLLLAGWGLWELRPGRAATETGTGKRAAGHGR